MHVFQCNLTFFWDSIIGKFAFTSIPVWSYSYEITNYFLHYSSLLFFHQINSVNRSTTMVYIHVKKSFTSASISIATEHYFPSFLNCNWNLCLNGNLIFSCFLIINFRMLKLRKWKLWKIVLHNVFSTKSGIFSSCLYKKIFFFFFFLKTRYG